MKKFSESERRIAQFLSYFPLFKKWVKLLYSYINYFLYKKSYKYSSRFDICSFSIEGHESFFGYYDKSPQNEKGYVLSHLSDFPTYKQPDPNVAIKLALFEPAAKPSLKYTVESNAYNWQQGARLQWLNEEYFIFNDFDKKKKKYISRVFSIHTDNEIKRFNFPIEDSFKMNYFLSLNFRRLQALRPDYGYQNLPPLKDNELQALENDGIWYVNYKTGENKLLISLKRVINIKGKKRFKRAKHYVNHIMISPNGDKFIFLHRYFKNGKRFDRLMLSDQAGNKIKVLADFDIVSHCYWIDNDHIIGYLNNQDRKSAFYLIDVNKGKLQSYTNKRLNAQGDGHPNVFGRWFVCDSYPDKSRMQHLTLNNLDTGKSIELGEFFHGFKHDQETRCDLHPRWCAGGDKISIDSVFNGHRKCYVVDVSDFNI